MKVNTFIVVILHISEICVIVRARAHVHVCVCVRAYVQSVMEKIHQGIYAKIVKKSFRRSE
jgi:hypothetical protein